MTREFNKRDAHMIKTGFNEGIRKALIDELIILTSILNTNDKYRIGEIEKRIEEIRKELAGVKGK